MKVAARYVRSCHQRHESLPSTYTQSCLHISFTAIVYTTSYSEKHVSATLMFSLYPVLNFDIIELFPLKGIVSVANMYFSYSFLVLEFSETPLF